MNIGFAMCGSFCTFSSVFPIMEKLAQTNNVIPIFSTSSSSVSCRFGNGNEFVEKATQICGKHPLLSIAEVEPIGPQKMLDILVIAPCTGNTIAKLANSIADTPVTMAAKSHLRNARPILVAVSTNDALAGTAVNIGTLLSRKHYYFVPFGQDAPHEKPTSIVADFQMIPAAIEKAIHGEQIQPVILY